MRSTVLSRIRTVVNWVKGCTDTREKEEGAEEVEEEAEDEEEEEEEEAEEKKKKRMKKRRKEEEEKRMREKKRRRIFKNIFPETCPDNCVRILRIMAIRIRDSFLFYIMLRQSS